MSETESGWVPVEALEAERDAVSVGKADAMLALAPRERVVELMQLAAAGKAADHPLRAADLARVLASFEGADLPVPETLARLFPGSVLPSD